MCFSRDGGADLPAGGMSLSACRGFHEEVGLCPGLPACEEALDCEFSDWEDWYYAGGCAGICFRHRGVRRFSNELGKPCGGPTQVARECLQDPGYMSECPYHWHRSARTNTKADRAPNDCQWADWSDWGDCSRKCGGGESGRYRHMKVQPHDGGAACEPVVREEVVPCNTQRCHDGCDDVYWSPWAAWGACSVSCGRGLQLRRREAMNNTALCAHPLLGSAEEVRRCVATSSTTSPKADSSVGAGGRCSLEAEQQACALGDWRDWGACDSDCGDGERTRRRELTATTIIADLEQRLDGLRRHAGDLEQDAAQLQAEKLAEESKSRDLDATIADLQRQQRGSEIQLEQAESQVAEAEKRNGELENDSAQLRENLGALGQRVQELQDDAARLRQEREALAATDDALREELGNLRLQHLRHLYALQVCGGLALVASVCIAISWIFGARGVREVEYSGMGGAGGDSGLPATDAPEA